MTKEKLSKAYCLWQYGTVWYWEDKSIETHRGPFYTRKECLADLENYKLRMRVAK